MRFSGSVFTLLAIKLCLADGADFVCKPCDGQGFIPENTIPLLGACGDVYALESFEPLDQATCTNINSVVRFSGCCSDGSTNTQTEAEGGIIDALSIPGLPDFSGLTGGDAINMEGMDLGFDFTSIGDSIMGFLGIDNSPIGECSPCSLGEYQPDVVTTAGVTCSDMFAETNTTGFDAISCATTQSLFSVAGCCKVEGTGMSECSLCGSKREFDPAAITETGETCEDTYAGQVDMMNMLSGFACSSVQDLVVLSGCCGEVPTIKCDPCPGNSTFVPDKTMMLGGTCRENFPLENIVAVTDLQCQATQTIVSVGGCCETNGEAVGGIGGLMNAIPGLAEIPGLEALDQEMASSTCSACDPTKDFYPDNEIINGTTCGASVPLTTELPSFACVLQQTVVGGLGCCSPPFDICTPCAADEQFYAEKGLLNGTTCADTFNPDGFLELTGIDCTSTQAVVRFTGCCGPKAAPPGSCKFCSEDKGEFLPDKVISSGKCGDIYSQETFDKFNGFLCTQNQGAVNRAGCCSNPQDVTETVLVVDENAAALMDSGDEIPDEKSVVKDEKDTVDEAEVEKPAEETPVEKAPEKDFEPIKSEEPKESTSGSFSKSISMIFVAVLVTAELLA